MKNNAVLDFITPFALVAGGGYAFLNILQWLPKKKTEPERVDPVSDPIIPPDLFTWWDVPIWGDPVGQNDMFWAYLPQTGERAPFPNRQESIEWLNINYPGWTYA